jgi:hypothetical protein
MRKVLFLASLVMLLISCQNNQPKRFRTASAEIDLLKKGLSDYENANWAEWSKQYADSAKIFQNTWLEGVSPEEVKVRHEELIANLSSYSFDKNDMTMEQIIDDKGRTWVNFWGIWKGTLKANSKEIFIPVHLTIQFKNGKVIEEFGFWDTAKLNEELQKVEYASSEN